MPKANKHIPRGSDLLETGARSWFEIHEHSHCKFQDSMCQEIVLGMGRIVRTMASVANV